MDFYVIQREVNATKISPVNILCDCVIVCEENYYMVKVVVAYILDAKIINNEYKRNGASFVVPKSWRSGGFVVASIIKACAE